MIALAALFVAAQPVAAKPSAEWLSGLWVEQKKAGSQDLEKCASWDALFYRGDNTFGHGEREGYWLLRGNKVYQFDRLPDGEAEEEVLAAATDGGAVVVRLGRDRMRKLLPGGKSVTFLRCPKPETPVAL
jgi:hypothetical protein